MNATIYCLNNKRYINKDRQIARYIDIYRQIIRSLDNCITINLEYMKGLNSKYIGDKSKYLEESFGSVQIQKYFVCSRLPSPRVWNFFSTLGLIASIKNKIYEKILYSVSFTKEVIKILCLISKDKLPPKFQCQFPKTNTVLLKLDFSY